MKTIHTALILIGLFFLMACDDAPKTNFKKVENPLAGYVDALEKAKDANSIVDDAYKKQREAIKNLQ